jgi:hypothetical protein
MNNSKNFRTTILFLCIFFTACSNRHKKAEASPLQQQAKSQMDSIIKLAAQTTQNYKNMDNPSLLKKLTEQSKLGKEPFNSVAYRELQGRSDVNSDTLINLIHNTGNGDALLPLLLLRKLNEKAYRELPAELRANVLTDALQKSKTFNTWGLLNGYLEDASQAMLECGASPNEALKRMLPDTTAAPVYGSRQYMAYKQYKFRRCDYALFFLKKIQGSTNFTIPVSVPARDSLIKDALK